jgi:hypothetical protein
MSHLRVFDFDPPRLAPYHHLLVIVIMISGSQFENDIFFLFPIDAINLEKMCNRRLN